MGHEWRGRSSSANRGDRYRDPRGWHQACDLVEDIERDVQQKVEDFLARRRPSGRTGAPSYTHDEVLSFARTLVSHHLEGVRSALREMRTPAQGLQLDANTMLPDPLPDWLEHSRSNLELFAPLRSSDLEATTKHLRDRLRTLASSDDGLPLGDDITIRRDSEDRYWACYEASAINLGGNQREMILNARESVWNELRNSLESNKIHEVVLRLQQTLDTMSPEGSFDYLAADPKNRAELRVLGRERQSLAAIRQVAKSIGQANAASDIEPDQFILTITQTVSKLASQARPGGEFADVQLFRLLTFLALRATYRRALIPETKAMRSAPKSAREELANFVLERTAVLVDSEYQLRRNEGSWVPELCDVGHDFLRANEQPWLSPPTLPPRVRPDQMNWP